MNWERARERDKLRQEREPIKLGAMTEKRRRYLRDRQARLRAEAARRRTPRP